ncbi:MAG: hypothetical protein Kow00121_34400 [Elainellaceae cyanobacterium]
MQVKDIERLAGIIWVVTLLLGFVYSRETTYPNGSVHGWSYSGFQILGTISFIAAVVISVKTYKLFRKWLHQQGLLDQAARLPIRIGFLLPFVICFFSFFQARTYAIDETTVKITRGWGDPEAGLYYLLFLAIFFIVLQIYHILKRQVYHQPTADLIESGAAEP